MGHTFRSFAQSEQVCIFSEKHHWLYYQFIADEVTPSHKERKIQRVFPPDAHTRKQGSWFGSSRLGRSACRTGVQHSSM